jgi:hypothetical protein
LHRVLDGSPAPFSAASVEKSGALSHFEPRNVLISRGTARIERRAFHDAALQPDQPVHALASVFDAVVGEEVARLKGVVGGRPITWWAFADAWSRIVRRVVFGDGARGDTALTDDLARLRAHAEGSALGLTPAGTGLLVHAPFFHRDERRLPFAHRFAPDVWLAAGRPEDAYALMPFSDGPVRCPGRAVVELIGSSFLATLFETHAVVADTPGLRPGRDLPGTLDHFALRLRLRPA